MPTLRRWDGDLVHPPVLVGEDNPYGGRPANALLPTPKGSAGHRLCTKIFGMDPRQYMLAFLRYNLCTGKWDVVEAQRRAMGLGWLYAGNPIIMLGSKVKSAFSLPPMEPFDVVDIAHNGGFHGRYLYLPHPSGRCRAWNEPGAYDKARDALEEVLRG